MLRYVLRRIAASALLLFLVLTGVFLLLRLAPGDPMALLETPRIPAEAREELRRSWGLDQPLATQYVRWLGGTLAGDWGTSFSHHRPATDVVRSALPATLWLGGAALLLQLLLGLPLGTLAARRAGSLGDHGLRVLSLSLYATPTFWLGIVALLCFTYRWPIFPPSHLQSVFLAPGAIPLWSDRLHHLALPVLVLGISGVGGWIRYTRASVLEVLSQDHLVALRARGIPERRVLWIHALRSALPSLLQVLGFTLPLLLSGALILEVLFSWPGLGQVTYGALLSRDYPLILA